MYSIANAKADTSKAPDEIKKSEERSELCRREVESSKDSYLKSLEELNKYNSKYMDDMHMVFDRCNEFEQARLDFVKEMLFKTHECLNIAYDDTLPTIFSAFRASIENADSAKVSSNLMFVKSKSRLKTTCQANGPSRIIRTGNRS